MRRPQSATRLSLDDNGAPAAQTDTHRNSARRPGFIVGIVQTVRHRQEQASLGVVRRPDPADVEVAETQRTVITRRGFLADCEALTADFLTGNEYEKVR